MSALPEWMCNVTIPMDRREAAEWGRAYYDLSEPSRAELLRKLLLAGAKAVCPDTARTVESIRLANERIKHGLLILLTLGVTIQTLTGSAEARSFRVRGRRQEHVCVIPAPDSEEV